MSEVYRIGHLEVETPWGNAGGVVKTPQQAEAMAQSDVGWIEAGSYVLEKREEILEKREDNYHHNPLTGETFNAKRLQGPGIDVAELDIAYMAGMASSLGKKLVVNIAPTSEDPASDLRELATRSFKAGADAVLINASCPTVANPERREDILSYNPKYFREVILGLGEIAEKYSPFFVRISPQESYEDMRELLRPLKPDVASCVFVPNTWPVSFKKNENSNPILQISGGSAGKSGPAMADEAFKQTAWALAAARIGGRKIDVVSSSGIMTGKELYRKVNLGAAAGAGSTIYYESPKEEWPEVTGRLLRQFGRATLASRANFPDNS